MGVTITQAVQPTQRGLILYNTGVAVPTGMRSKSSLCVIGRGITNPGRVEAAAAGGDIFPDDLYVAGQPMVSQAAQRASRF